jgi:glycine/D-amino acid oxidase-like deaminating enzyme
MPQKIAVIGAGLTGCLTAITLAERGHKVVLFDKKDEIMSGTSRIPLHLHEGGMYVCDPDNDQTLRDCLSDATEFKTKMKPALINRLMAFAVMSDAAITEEAKRGGQAAKVSEMERGFAKLAGFASPSTPYLYQFYNKSQLEALKERLEPDEEFDKATWKLLQVTNLAMVEGLVMTKENGLYMQKAKEHLNALLASNGVEVVHSAEVKGLRRQRGMYEVTTSQSSTSALVEFDQIVNATGYEGYQIDRMARTGLSIPEDKLPEQWGVVAKGIGIVKVDKGVRSTVSELPEACFMHGPGMTHFAPLPYGRAGVTYTDREGTTFGEINIPVKHSEGEDETKMQKMNEDFLDKHTEDLLTRTQACLSRCATFLHVLEGSTPKEYIPGALGVVNPRHGASARSSQRLYCSHDGYHAVNSVKGGGAVASARAVVDAVEKYARLEDGVSRHHNQLQGHMRTEMARLRGTERTKPSDTSGVDCGVSRHLPKLN